MGKSDKVKLRMVKSLKKVPSEIEDEDWELEKYSKCAVEMKVKVSLFEL